MAAMNVVLDVLNKHSAHDEWVGHPITACACGHPWDTDHIARAIVAALADEGAIPDSNY